MLSIKEKLELSNQQFSVAFVANQRDKYLSPSQWSSSYLGRAPKMVAKATKAVRLHMVSYPREHSWNSKRLISHNLTLIKKEV